MILSRLISITFRHCSLTLTSSSHDMDLDKCGSSKVCVIRTLLYFISFCNPLFLGFLSGNFAEAKSCFEKVIEKDPQNHEAMKVSEDFVCVCVCFLRNSSRSSPPQILASLLAKENLLEHRAKIEKFLQKVVEVNPKDVEAWVELAESQERVNIGGALKCKESRIWLFSDVSFQTLCESRQLTKRLRKSWKSKEMTLLCLQNC